jgi:hypothetical protein
MGVRGVEKEFERFAKTLTSIEILEFIGKVCGIDRSSDAEEAVLLGVMVGEWVDGRGKEYESWMDCWELQERERADCAGYGLGDDK